MADLVVVVHAAFVLAVVLGGFATRRRPRLAWLHLPVALWGTAVELVPGAFCPLTPLEQLLRRKAGGVGYSGGFIAHYLEPVIYPGFLTRGWQIALGALVVLINVWAYRWWWHPRLRRRGWPGRRRVGPRGESLASMSPDATRILFLCTGNSCRSQMAEGFARRLAPAGVEVLSAGTEPRGLHPLAVEIMREAGVDISRQRSKGLDAVPVAAIDTVITLCGHANERCPVFPGARRREHWPVEDPAQASGTDEEVRAAFRRVREDIRDRVARLLASAPSPCRRAGAR